MLLSNGYNYLYGNSLSYLLYLINFILFSIIICQNLKNQQKVGVREIFKDNRNWERYKIANYRKLNDWIIKNVNKMLKYKDGRVGYLKYICEKCGETKTIFFEIYEKIE